MSKLRSSKPGDVIDIHNIITCLKQAREICKRVGARQTLAKIRSAIKSAEGAERHLTRIRNEEARRVA